MVMASSSRLMASFSASSCWSLLERLTFIGICLWNSLAPLTVWVYSGSPPASLVVPQFLTLVPLPSLSSLSSQASALNTIEFYFHGLLVNILHPYDFKWTYMLMDATPHLQPRPFFGAADPCVQLSVCPPGTSDTHILNYTNDPSFLLKLLLFLSYVSYHITSHPIVQSRNPRTIFKFSLSPLLYSW